MVLVFRPYNVVIIFSYSTFRDDEIHSFEKNGKKIKQWRRAVKIKANWNFRTQTKLNQTLTNKITVHKDCCWEITSVDNITTVLNSDNGNYGIYSPNKNNLPYPLYIKTVKSKICDT